MAANCARDSTVGYSSCAEDAEAAAVAANTSQPPTLEELFLRHYADETSPEPGRPAVMAR